MASPVARATAAAHRAAARVRGGCIVITQGDYQVSVLALFGRTEYQVDIAGEVRTEHTDADFLILMDELILNGQIVDPVPGMRIVKADESDVVYEVMNIPGGKCFKKTGSLVRLHAKRVS